MKSKMFRRLMAISLSTVMTVGLAGCGSSTANRTSAGQTGTSAASEASSENASSDVSASETASASGDKVKLSFYIWSDEENYISKVVDSYNASQNKVEVDLNTVASDDYDDKLKVMLAGDTSVDLVDIRGVAQMTTYANQGALLDISDRISKSGLDTSKYGDMWKTSDVDGKYYALPTRTTCWALFYNADLLKEAGVDAPGQMTWEEYVDYSKKVADGLKGKTASDGTAVKAGYWVPWIYHFYSVQHGVYANDKDTQYIQKSLELLNTLMTNGTHYSYADVSSGTYDYMSEFENGHTALLPNGEWCVNMLMNAAASGDTSVNWEVAPMPVPEGVADGTSWGQFQYAAVTSGCKHPDEAYDFLNYLCGEKGSEIYASTGMIHAYSSDSAEQALEKASGKESVHYLFDAKKVQEQPNAAGYDEFLNALKENAELYFLGEEDINKCMKDFTAQADELRAKYNK